VQVPEARIVADSTGRLHVAYCDQSNNRLKYAYFDDGWHIQVVDQVENIGSYVSLAVDSQGCVHIAYFAQEGLNPYLKYARTISDYYPASQFTFSSQDGKVPFPVQFTDQSTGAITSWFWQFGDGQTSTAKDPLHYYASSGNFDVSLKVSGPAGSSTRIIKNCVYTYTLPPSRPFLAYVGEQLNTFGRLLTIDCRAHAIRERLWLPNEPYGLAASRKGDQVWLSFAGTRSDIWKLDRTTGAITILPAKLGTWALGFSPDDRYLYAATYHGVNYFSRVNLADNAVTAMPLSFGGSRTLAVTPDGRSVFLATESYFDGIEYLAGYFAQISDPNAASPGIEPISVGDMVNWGIAVHPNNRYLYVGAIAPNLVNGYLDVCPLDDFRRFRKRTVILSGWPFGIAVSPDGNWVYVTLDNGAVAIIDTAALTVVKEVVVGGGPRGLAFTPDGKFAYVCSWKKITAIDTANHEIAAIMDTEGWAFDIAIVPAVVGQPGLPSWLPLLLDD
jgi:YVTN family beta-propeller protein